MLIFRPPDLKKARAMIREPSRMLAKPSPMVSLAPANPAKQKRSSLTIRKPHRALERSSPTEQFTHPQKKLRRQMLRKPPVEQTESSKRPNEPSAEQKNIEQANKITEGVKKAPQRVCLSASLARASPSPARDAGAGRRRGTPARQPARTPAVHTDVA